VFVNFWKNSSQQGDPLYGTLFCLLVVLHWAVVECPETDLRMNLKHPPLAVRCNRIVNLFDLGDDPASHSAHLRIAAIMSLTALGAVSPLRRDALINSSR